MSDIVKEAMGMLDKAGIKYDCVYIYDGCSEACGPMPRVVVQQCNTIPVCYSITELSVAIADGKPICIRTPTCIRPIPPVQYLYEGDSDE